MRELDRERAKMEQQEKKIIADIKKMAKQGKFVFTHVMLIKFELWEPGTIFYQFVLGCLNFQPPRLKSCNTRLKLKIPEIQDLGRMLVVQQLVEFINVGPLTMSGSLSDLPFLLLLLLRWIRVMPWWIMGVTCRVSFHIYLLFFISNEKYFPYLD